MPEEGLRGHELLDNREVQIPLAANFEKIRISPVLSDELMMDATEYHLHIQSSAGVSLELTLYGPGPQEPHQPPGLVQRADLVRASLVESLRE